MADKAKRRTALHCALDLLSRREHFKSELERKLRLRDFEENEIQTAIAEAIEQGWQSEERACESYVRFRMQKGFGPLKILSELQQRRVESTLVHKWLPANEAIWLELLSTVAAKKYGLKPGEKLQPKQLRFLLSRGFTSSQIKAAF